MTSFYVSRIFVDVMLGECLNYAAFHWAFATAVTCQQGTLTLRTPGSVFFRGGGGGLYMLRLLSLAFPDLHKFHYFHTDLDLYQIARAFHWSFATSVACHQGRLPFRTLGSIPFLRLAYATIVETSFLDFTLVFFFFMIFHLECPSVLSRFCSQQLYSVFKSQEGTEPGV